MSRTVLLAASAAVFLCFSAALAGDARPARSTAASTAAASARLLDAVIEAPDASSAVEAYARARAAMPRRTAVPKAYVRRMTELGQPQMALAQARDVLDVEIGEPLALAVLAGERARNGDAEGAIRGIVTAVANDSYEPFVRRTSGQILAWLDTRSGRMAEDIETSAASMRKVVGGTSEFEEAYKAAREAYAASRAATGKDAAAALPATRPAATLLADAVPADFETDPLIYAWSSPRWSYGWCAEIALRRLGCDVPRWTPRHVSAWCFETWYGDRSRLGRRSRFGWADGIYTTRLVTRSTPFGHYSTSRWGGRGVAAYSCSSGWYGARSSGWSGAACAPQPSCEPRHCR